MDIENAIPPPQTKKERHWRLSMVLLVILISLGNLAQAYSGGVIATTLGQPSFLTYMELDTMENASAVIGATGSLFYAGGFFGSFFGSWIGDRFGRKPAIFVGLIFVLVSMALCTASTHIAMFIVFRFTCGFGALILNLAVPLWVAECVPPEVRGAFAQISGAAISLGYFLSSYVGVAFFLNTVSGPNAWRGPLGVGCALCLPPLIGIWWVPESPRYLFLKGRREEAKSVVLKLHATPHEHSQTFAEMELLEMDKQIEIERSLESSWLTILKRPSYRKRFLLSSFMVFTIQATGSQVLSIYATIIYRNLGYSEKKTLLLQAAIYATGTPFSALAIIWTEYFKRPTLVAIGIAGMVVTLSAYTGLAAQYTGSNNSTAQEATVAMTFLFFVCYAAAAEGPFYYYSSEIFPTHLRAKGATIQSITFSWTSVLWAQVGPIGIANVEWRFFLICICLATIGGLVIFFFYPDTRGKSLEEIAALFGDEDLVAIYQRDVDVNISHQPVVSLPEEKRFVEESA